MAWDDHPRTSPTDRNKARLTDNYAAVNPKRPQTSTSLQRRAEDVAQESTAQSPDVFKVCKSSSFSIRAQARQVHVRFLP